MLTDLHNLRSRILRLIARAKSKRRRARVAWLRGRLFAVELDIVRKVAKRN
jgi:hypothetical protein